MRTVALLRVGGIDQRLERARGCQQALAPVVLDGQAAPLVGRIMNELVADWEFSMVGGLTMGADPVALAMLHQTAAAGGRLDAFVVRKDAKTHG